ENHIKKAEEKIALLEQEIEELTKALNETGSDFVKAAELSAIIDTKNEELMETYAIWEELQ
ncbi:MAG: hypothetical protein IKY39_04535, partial [Clostridia bacterium]|nr:hypothetical protein [Clostridia bacterium]